MVFLASYGTIVGDLFASWEQAGFFEYLFPLLLIFALVFGILSKINLFKDNKALNGLIALIIGLIAIQSPYVSSFFGELFPRLGIGLVILLCCIIVIGLTLPPKWSGAFLAVAVVIIILVLVNTAGAVGWSSGYWWGENWTNVLGLVIIIGLVGAVIFSGSSGGNEFEKSMLGKLLKGE